MAHRLSYYIRSVDGRCVFDTKAFSEIIKRLPSDPDIVLFRVNKGDFADLATPLQITSTLNIRNVIAERDSSVV